MRAGLAELLAARGVLLADGGTGTNYFAAGLDAGEAPELWNVDHPDRVRDLHRRFVDAGADIVLTNTFGCNRHRLALHGAQARAAELAGEVAEAAERPVVVAGSVGPTGSLFEPLGELTEADAHETFGEQIET